MAKPKITLAERFWSKVSIGPSDACWPWQSSKWGVYGVFWFAPRYEAAHRVAWILTFGPIPDGLWVLHKCDNPPCCNPAHLFLGTHRDNMLDMHRKRRGAKCPECGQHHPGSKLNHEAVRAIRSELVKGRSQAAIGREFGVSHGTIHLIANGITWNKSATREKESQG